MKELTCEVCEKKYLVDYTYLKDQTGKCPTCQFDYEISQTQKNIDFYRKEKLDLKDELEHLCKLKDQAEIIFLDAKRAWTKKLHFYTRLDRKEKLSQHALDIKLNRKSLQIKKKTKTNQKTAQEKALEVLKNLTPEQQKAVLNKINKGE